MSGEKSKVQRSPYFIMEECDHVDTFIDYGRNEVKHIPNEKYARWVLNHFRLPAVRQLAFHDFMKERKLFCDFEGKRYRVTGASRFGDIWLVADFKRETGYDLRVECLLCSNWDGKA